MAFIGLFISFPGRDSTGKRIDSENDVRLVGGYRKGILALEMSPCMTVTAPICWSSRLAGGGYTIGFVSARYVEYVSETTVSSTLGKVLQIV